MIKWDKEKNEKLKRERGISFKEVEEILESGEYLDRIENPVREGQFIFVIFIRDYVWLVPFVVDMDKNIILKTMYPSRKYYKVYNPHV